MTCDWWARGRGEGEGDIEDWTGGCRLNKIEEELMYKEA